MKFFIYAMIMNKRYKRLNNDNTIVQLIYDSLRWSNQTSSSIWLWIWLNSKMIKMFPNSKTFLLIFYRFSTCLMISFCCACSIASDRYYRETRQKHFSQLQSDTQRIADKVLIGTPGILSSKWILEKIGDTVSGKKLKVHIYYDILKHYSACFLVDCRVSSFTSENSIGASAFCTSTDWFDIHSIRSSYSNFNCFYSWHRFRTSHNITT